MRAVRSGKTPYVRFDRNLYSIPHTHVRKPLTLLASATRIRILDAQTELANHHRTYNTGVTVEGPPRIWKDCSPPPAKPTSTPPATGCAPPSPPPPRSSSASPSAKRPCARTRHGCSPLLDDYGPDELAAAVTLALERDALGAGSITHILETRRRQRGLRPPLRLTLPDRPGLRDLDVRSHDLETYDALGRHNHDDAGD